MTTPAPRELDARAVLLILLLSAIWGGHTVAVKIGFADGPPLALAWIRFLIGGACVVLWGWWTRAPFALDPGEFGPLLGLGLLFAVQLGLLNVGTWLSTAGHAAVLVNGYPVHVVVLAHFLVPGDRMTAAKLGGVLLGYAGIVLLFWPQLVTAARPDSNQLVGDVVLSVSALLLGLRQVLLNRQLQVIHPVKALLAQVIVGTPLFALLSAFFETQPIVPTVRLAGAMLYQGVIVAGFNFIVLMWVLKHYRPSAVAAFSLTTPIFGVVATAIVLLEPITWPLGVAALFVAGGIAIASLRREPARGVAAAPNAAAGAGSSSSSARPSAQPTRSSRRSRRTL